jgi:hypothetical protein
MNYVTYASQQADELQEMFSQEDIEQLHADLEQLGPDGWLNWAEENRHEANIYLKATAIQRGKKKRWQEPVLRRRLAFSAYHQARLAAAMLDAARSLGPGGGYRETAALAANIGFDLMRDGEWRWPFLDLEPPKGWPGPHMEPWVSGACAVVPTGQPKPQPEIRRGYDAT